MTSLDSKNSFPEESSNFKHEIKKLEAGIALTIALFAGNPAQAQAQAPEKQTPPTEQVEKKELKTENLENKEVLKKADAYMKEAEDFMYKNYHNYQKYYTRVFSVIRTLNHDKETQKWMIEMRKELYSMFKDYIEYEIITTEEEKGCFLFGMMEIMVGSCKFSDEQISILGGEMYGGLGYFSQNISRHSKPLAQYVQEQAKATRQKLEATNQKLEATNQKLEATNQKLEATIKEVESNFLEMEKIIKTYTLTNFLKDSVLQRQVKLYLEVCKRENRTPIPYALELSQALKNKGKQTK